MSWSNKDQPCREWRMIRINALSTRTVGGVGVGSGVSDLIRGEAVCLEQILFTAVSHLRCRLAF